MHPQSSLGGAPQPVSMTPGRPLFNLGQVVDVVPNECAVKVMLAGGTVMASSPKGQALKVTVLSRRAGPWVGDIDLPRIGEWGLIAFPYGSDQLAVWLGSLHQTFAHLGTGDQDQRLSHHDSGVWQRIGKDGSIELSHPSGTYLRIGPNTTLTPRTRQELQENGMQTVPYDIPSKPTPVIYLKHSSGTDITIDSAGNLTVNVKANATSTIDGNKTETVKGNAQETVQGNKQETVQQAVTENYQQAYTLTIGADGTITATGQLSIQADDITIQSTNAAPGKCHLGGSAGEDWIALKASLDQIKVAFDTHTHGGVKGGPDTSAPPTAPMPPFVPDTHYSGQSKAS